MKLYYDFMYYITSFFFKSLKFIVPKTSLFLQGHKEMPWMYLICLN